MSSRRLLALVLLLVSVPQARVRAGELEGEQKLSKRIGDVVVTVVARMRDGGRCLNPEGWGWGSDQKCPRKVIAALTVKMDKKAIFVPVSAYGDLANPGLIAVKPTRVGFEVSIRGGDAATAYSATLQFERDSTAEPAVLRVRTVRSGEFQDEAWEETRYHFNNLSEVEPPIR